METLSIRQGQHEIGIVRHEGREFHAMGSSVHGRHVTGYTRRDKRGNISLTRWSGLTMLSCRSDVVREFDHEWHSPVALVFALTGGRFIVGYALESDGGLFRGELITDSTADDAARAAIAESEYWMERDWEDEQQFEYEQSLASEDEDDSEDD